MVSSLTLTFHGVRRGPAAVCPSEDRAAAAYTVDAGRLEHALDMLEPRSCCTVAGLPSASHGQRLVVTFDDGLASDFTIALPALLDRGLKATFFVTVDNIGLEGYTTAAQLREMCDAGMEIASHGLTHRYLVSMSRRETVREICESKTRLEQQLGQRVTSFAPVGGHFHDWMAGAVAEAGYRAMATMVPGRTVRSGRPLMLRRNHVQSHHDCEYIARLVAGHRPTLTAARLRHQLLRLPKSILGMRNYDRRVFDLAGYFDEDFDAAEDVEFHHRLKLAGIDAVTSPDLTIYSYPRETLRGLFGQMTRYGIGRARLVRWHPTAMTKETLIPPAVLLVCGLAPLAAAASWWVPLVGLAWLCLLMPYLMALAATGLVMARNRNRAALGPLVSLAIWTTHVGLGWGFLRTILLPGRCILPSRRVSPAPCRPMLNDA
ncbi:MAG: polysaccharide deacetylase family protein [Planctomycetota bacterium]